MKRAALTPMMQQYRAAKAAYPDCILFFRMGDFFELFYEDAEKVSRLLGLTLTSRTKGEDAIPMAGVPVKNVDTYLRRLVGLGHRVAICDQVEDPKKAKDLVERQVVRVVTPGTLTEEGALEGGRPHYLAAVAPGRNVVGLAWADLSTGEFHVAEVDPERVVDELGRLQPAELLVPEDLSRRAPQVAAAVEALETARTSRPDWAFGAERGARQLREHLGVADLRGFDCDDLGPALGAAGALLHYLRETQKAQLSHIRRITRRRAGEAMFLDQATCRALELTANLRDGGLQGTLLQVIDTTVTPMGTRRLRAWLLAPLVKLEAIRRRQEGVERFVADGALRAAVREALKDVYDLERLVGKLGCGRANARDLVALRRSLLPLPALRDRLAPAVEVPLLADLAADLDPCADVAELIGRALVDDPPVGLTEGGIIRPGYHAELDALRSVGREGETLLRRLQEREAARTGIANLKVGFNRVFGYYIEVTRANAHRVPADYVRKQTLKNAERYITPELKEFEAQVLRATERIQELEYELFLDVRGRVHAHIHRLERTARAVARLDAVAALAQTAVERHYVRPELVEDPVLEVDGGRHPVLEAVLAPGTFVPNDLRLDGRHNRLLLITGPNMAGKSTYIRQTALQVLLAQMGSFVPAERARLGIVDRIFTRVGAADDLSRGLSTFMVEMTEVANILHHATDRSLLVLDEVGRGTSTYDGVSIAWAVAEHLARHLRARTLFATHYHELTALAAEVEGVRNVNVAVREWGDEVVFLHRIVPGAADRSYGIHVARLAGVPREVVARAQALLAELESRTEAARRPRRPGRQLSLFAEPEHPVLARLREVDPERLTPLEALALLTELKGALG